uniref:Tha8 n=1 Tax=Arundo donax TaxID=35708 RepID=A0A0A9EW66_ARUDO
MAATRSALRSWPREEAAAAEAAAGERSADVRRFRDWMARMASVERDRPRWSGPRLSRGPQVMASGLARALGPTSFGRALGVGRGTKRRDAMGGVEARGKKGKRGC